MSHPATPVIPEILHFIGAGGSGMAPLAHYSKSLGCRVTGSDSVSSNNTKKLEAAGIRVFHQHDPHNLPQAATVIVSSAIPPQNPELAAASQRGQKIMHRSELLTILAQSKTPLVVSGTHGKTTTSGMLGWLLNKMGKNPDMIIGASLNDTGHSWQHNSGNYFVVEADESDGSFLRFRPHIGIITNIDKDHLDFYGDTHAIEEAFSNFAQQTSTEGRVIVGTDSPAAHRVFCSLSQPALSYGLSGHCDVRATGIRHRGEFTEYHLHVSGTKMTTPVVLRSTGAHNVLNSLGAIATVIALGFSPEEACLHLKHFPGISRRLSLLFRNERVSLLDDYAHNPGKTAACIEAVRKAWPGSHVKVIFQPHRYSRLQTMYRDFVTSFKSADEVLCCPVFAAGEPHDARFSPTQLAEDISTHSRTKAVPFVSENETLEAVVRTERKNTVILTVGAGDITLTAHKLASMLEKYFEASERTSCRAETPKKT